jgi:hypothetical protein
MNEDYPVMGFKMNKHNQCGMQSWFLTSIIVIFHRANGKAQRNGKDGRAELDCERRLITSYGTRINAVYIFDRAAAGATLHLGFNKLFSRIVDGYETDMEFIEAFKKHYDIYCVPCMD